MAKTIYYSLLAVLALGIDIGHDAPTGLLCEHRHSPALGINVAGPHFSWILPHLSECAAPNHFQHSYQFQLSSELAFSTFVWDSQRIVSGDCSHTTPETLGLLPAGAYYWRVKTWSIAGDNVCESGWSDSAKFTTALWEGLGNGTTPIWTKEHSRYAMFRKDLGLNKQITSAVAHVTASPSAGQEKLLGAYRFHINGKVVGIGPGRGEVYVRDANHTMYDTIDVTDVVKSGIANQTLKLAFQCYHQNGGPDARVLLEMHILFTDGSKMVVHTDETWFALDATDLFNPSSQTTGGRYISPQENINGSAFPGQDTWTMDPIKDGGSWQLAAKKPAFEGLKPKMTLPIEFIAGVKPTSLEKVTDNHYFFDFGEDMMGGIRIDLLAPVPAGLSLQLTLSEELVGPQQVLYPMRTSNHYRSVWSTGVGSGEKAMVMEHHEYMLFRYGELVISANQTMHAGPDALKFSLFGWRVRYPWSEGDSQFDSSDEMLNKVWKLCRDTLRITSLDTTVDSSTRERLPYEADGAITGSSRYVFQREYMWQRHSAVHNFLNPTWPTEWRQFMPLITFADYLQTGDTTLFDNFYPLLFNSTQATCINNKTSLVDFSSGNDNCKRSCEDGKSSCSDNIDWPPNSRDGYVITDISTVINAFAVKGLRALATMSGAIGQHEQAKTLAESANAVAKSMNDKLWDQSTGLYVDGLGSDKAKTHSAWHAQTNPLWAQNVVPFSRQSKMFDFLKGKRMAGSVYGAFAFLLALYEMDFDHGKFALEMMTNCDTNSWCHMLQVGATATMEAWSRKEKPNLSWSHPWATAPATAIAQGFMGLRPLSPKYSSFLFKPQPGNATFGSILLPTLSGPIKASFEVVPDTSFTAKLLPPPNTHARVCLPEGSAMRDTELIVDGKTVKGSLNGDYVCVDGIGSSSQERVIERKLKAKLYV